MGTKLSEDAAWRRKRKIERSFLSTICSRLATTNHVCAQCKAALKHGEHPLLVLGQLHSPVYTSSTSIFWRLAGRCHKRDRPVSFTNTLQLRKTEVFSWNKLHLHCKSFWEAWHKIIQPTHPPCLWRSTVWFLWCQMYLQASAFEPVGKTKKENKQKNCVCVWFLIGKGSFLNTTLFNYMFKQLV